MRHKSPLFDAPKKTEICPKCGGELHIKTGKKGLFLGCSHYPQCDYLKPLHQVEPKILKVLDECCPECGHLLVLKQGQYGMFIGCSHFPECDYIVHEETEDQQLQQAIPCPYCKKGHLVERKGRQGKPFYGCNQYPRCRFHLSEKPLQKDCPKCGFPLVFEKEDNHYQCCQRSCQHTFIQEE